MVSTRYDLRFETPFEGSNPPPTTMIDTNILQQLQNRIAEMEQHHGRPKGDEHSAYTLPELTQGESHPFTDRIMEADIPQGWKPLNLERLRQADAKSLSKFMDRFGRIVIQIYNPNPEVALHSMLLSLRLGIRSDKPNKSTTSENEAPRPTHTSQTRGKNSPTRGSPASSASITSMPSEKWTSTVLTNYHHEVFLPSLSLIGTSRRLEVSPDTIQPHVGPLLGFAREKVETRGYVDLMTTFGQGKLSNSFTIMYLIIDANTSYFALIGRKMLNELRAIVSIPHLKIKFPSLTGEIVTVKADQK
ncbi:hypothetical protein JHK85_028300 [Glycine max]|nr:hypothetical protein JHK85_028300 [Glycine max]